MTSRPVIERELSQTEHEFVAWVEAQLRAHRSSGAPRFSATVEAVDDAAFVERHTVEFRAERITHTMKRVEYRRGMCCLIESHFDLSGPDVPGGHAHHRDVEAAVRVRVDGMKAERWDGAR